MKLLLVTESWPPALNGVATSSVRLVHELRGREIDVRIIAPTADEPADRNVHRAHSIQVGPTPEYTLGRIGTHTIELIDRWRPDLVHVASPLSLGFSALRAVQRMAIPAIAAYLTDFGAFSRQVLRHIPGRDRVARAFDRAQRAVHAMAAVNVACSEYALSTLRRWESPQPREWLRAVDLQRFDVAQRERRLTAPSGPLRVGYAGRLAGEKELGLLTALTDLDVEVVLIGDGPYRVRLEQLLPTAVFTGKLLGDDYPRALSGLDVFVHPGRGETLSQVVLEALASGIPCVVPDSGSASTELVVPGLSGSHFRAGDADSLRTAVSGLLAAAPTEPAAIRRTIAHRTWERSIDSLLSSYDEALRAG